MSILQRVPFRQVLVWLGVFFLSLTLGLCLSFGAERWFGREQVLRGIRLGQVSLSGLTHEQLERLLSQRDADLKGTHVTLSLAGKEKSWRGEELGLSLDARTTALRIFKRGREGFLFRQAGYWFLRLWSDEVIEGSLALNEQLLAKSVLPWAQGFLKGPVPPSITYENGLIVIFPEGGTEVDLAKLGQELSGEVRRGESGPSASFRVTVPTLVRSPAVAKELVESQKKIAEQLLSREVQLLSPDKSERAVLKPEELGLCLLSIASDDKFSLTLDHDCLRAALSGFLERWEKHPVDAQFEFNKQGEISVAESASGMLLDAEELQRRLFEVGSTPQRTLSLPLKEAHPKLTQAQALELNIKELVSSFSTFHPCCQARVKNIHHAASLLDGVVLLSDETFSLNALLGPRTRSRGYVEAPTIIDGEMEDSFGGGISQLATTLFNAALRGGYEIVQRQPHSIYFPRYPEGHEATVSFPEPDLAFKNDTAAGLVIKTEYSPTMIKVLFYGDKEGRTVKLEKSQRYNVVQPPKEYEPSEDMDPGEAKRVRAGQLGWSVRVSRTVKKKDGSQKTEAREVVYRPRAELLRVHPCIIPKGEPGHTGEECPEPPHEEREEDLSEDEYFETR